MLRLAIVLVGIIGVDSFKIGIAGANGALGRELVYQSLGRRWDVSAITRRPTSPLFKPTRTGLFEEDTFSRIPMRTSALERTDYSAKAYDFDALVIAVGGKPFSEDTSDDSVAHICANLPTTCKRVCLVSAFGVGDSITRAGIGIKAMESWYLRDVYASKRRQEDIVAQLDETVDVHILRPRALSYTLLPRNPVTMSRKCLATTVLDWVEAPSESWV